MCVHRCFRFIKCAQWCLCWSHSNNFSHFFFFGSLSHFVKYVFIIFGYFCVQHTERTKIENLFFTWIIFLFIVSKSNFLAMNFQMDMMGDVCVCALVHFVCMSVCWLLVYVYLVGFRKNLSAAYIINLNASSFSSAFLCRRIEPSCLHENIFISLHFTM